MTKEKKYAFELSWTEDTYDADVAGELSLAGCQLTAKSLGSCLLGQPLYIDVIVCSLDLSHKCNNQLS